MVGLTQQIFHYIDTFYFPSVSLVYEAYFFNEFYSCTGLAATYHQQWLCPGSLPVPYRTSPPGRTSSSFYAK
jgi:hypothetical protein